MSEMVLDPAKAGAHGAQDDMPFHVREHHPENGTLLGFWIYLMSDCLIFAVLFIAYAVLGRNFAGGPSGARSGCSFRSSSSRSRRKPPSVSPRRRSSTTTTS